MVGLLPLRCTRQMRRRVIVVFDRGAIYESARTHHACQRRCCNMALCRARATANAPVAGSTVSESPHEVTLTFTDTLEAAFSSADVTESSGVRVDEGKSQVDGQHDTHCPQNAVAGQLSRSLAGGLRGYSQE